MRRPRWRRNGRLIGIVSLMCCTPAWPVAHKHTSRALMLTINLKRRTRSWNTHTRTHTPTSVGARSYTPVASFTFIAKRWREYVKCGDGLRACTLAPMCVYVCVCVSHVCLACKPICANLIIALFDEYMKYSYGYTLFMLVYNVGNIVPSLTWHRSSETWLCIVVDANECEKKELFSNIFVVLICYRLFFYIFSVRADE